MKILYVIPFFTPAMGGSIIVAGYLAKELVRRGHQVSIITTDYRYDQQYAQSIEDAGVEVIPFHATYNVGLFVYSPAMRSWIGDNIEHFDVVHLHDYRTYQNYVATKGATKHNVPCVLQPDNTMPRVVTKQASKWLYDVVCSKKILEATTRLIAISRQEVAVGTRAGIDPKKIVQIYMGIDFDPASDSTPQPGTFKAKYNINGRMILYLGRLHKSKGIDTLIRAFAELSEEISDAALVIIGSDEGYRDVLHRLTKELAMEHKVRFIGYVDHRDKLGAYTDAEVFTHAVRYMGGVALTPLEAILCGTPVIATEECGEIIKEADCGYIVEYGNVSELRNRMIQLLEDPQIGEQMVHRGKQYIQQYLRWDAIAQKVEEVYEGCVRHV